ncbi:hypothetical protein SeMB42_g04839 [Synchytrium endobioticum]|uniref:Uncharacterized protein n=1 Tax=Synchytrium endobioticum TaxID=286115 RepID=A0A507CVG7_9FUNG|nr:hypothetical protein SeMB42_g04839 [Synchytrium endobioticum]
MNPSNDGNLGAAIVGKYYLQRTLSSSKNDEIGDSELSGGSGEASLQLSLRRRHPPLLLGLGGELELFDMPRKKDT